MEKKDLIDLIDKLLKPIGFKRKGNNWVLNGDELTKVVNLQKSNYANSYYINYGYIINGVPLTTILHVEYRLAGSDKNENERITELLNLDVDISKDQRLKELQEAIADKIICTIQSINTEEDLLNDLKKQPHLNNIPLVVKKHFKLELPA